MDLFLSQIGNVDSEFVFLLCTCMFTCTYSHLSCSVEGTHILFIGFLPIFLVKVAHLDFYYHLFRLEIFEYFWSRVWLNFLSLHQHFFSHRMIPTHTHTHRNTHECITLSQPSNGRSVAAMLFAISQFQSLYESYCVRQWEGLSRALADPSHLWATSSHQYASCIMHPSPTFIMLSSFVVLQS